MSDFLDLFIDGRLVGGSLYEMNDKDWQGQPLKYKSGDKIGQPYKKSHVAMAVKKTVGIGHWGSEVWGAGIWAFGHGQFPKGEAQAATFAWKIEDGDSQIPNKKQRRNCDNPDWAGCWIVHAGQPERLPKIVTAHGDPLEQPGAVKLGYWGRLAVRIGGNGQFGGNAGIYINPQFFVYLGIDKEIVSGPNVRGMLATAPQFSLPSHVQSAPISAPVTVYGSGAGSPPAPAPAPNGIQGSGVASTPPPPAMGASALTPAPVAPAAVVLAPSPTFLAPPPPGVIVSVPAPMGPVMTAKAGTLTYAQFIAQGWNDAALRTNGYMV